MPHFQSLYEEMGDEFEIIAISNESKSTINNYIKNKKFTYYILHDRTGNVFKTWLAGHYPTNYMNR